MNTLQQNSAPINPPCDWCAPYACLCGELNLTKAINDAAERGVEPSSADRLPSAA